MGLQRGELQRGEGGQGGVTKGGGEVRCGYEGYEGEGVRWGGIQPHPLSSTHSILCSCWSTLYSCPFCIKPPVSRS